MQEPYLNIYCIEEGNKGREGKTKRVGNPTVCVVTCLKDRLPGNEYKGFEIKAADFHPVRGAAAGFSSALILPHRDRK